MMFEAPLSVVHEACVGPLGARAKTTNVRRQLMNESQNRKAEGASRFSTCQRKSIAARVHWVSTDMHIASNETVIDQVIVICAC
jgi:hypothetical protein